MKNIFHLFFLFVFLTLSSKAVTRGDIKVIEASENIRYLSQKLAKDYLFFYKYPQKQVIKLELEKSLFKLTDDIRIIATTTKDIDTKSILEFLAYSKDQISNIFNEKPDEEKAALMLDYSETLLEGADSIAIAHQYNFSEEEKMLMVTKEMEYLLERITKYYMAVNIGFNTLTNQEAMKEAIQGFEENIYQINFYKYPTEKVQLQIQLNDSWESSKMFFIQSKKLFIPLLMFSSVDYIENIISILALHHSKNQ